LKTFYLHYDNRLRTSDKETLMKVMNDIEENDKLIIYTPNGNSKETRYIIDTLENNGFDHSPKGSHYGKDYSIIAQLKSNN